jgi:hypothetical protein
MFATGDSCEVIKTEHNDEISKNKTTPDGTSAISFLNHSYTPSVIDTHHQASRTTTQDQETFWEQVKA